ncbi:hypothetical protein [Formosa sp. L2A11]|uniref:hypothetical protein n=1 Tax=Formosa sp. L2A11 TaxID=2686363 RepID=UPI00131B632A|nr:hypothetical protein [Formosa sp. L2A11]
MKKYILTLVISLISIVFYAQEDYMQQIVDQACSCVKAIPDEEFTTENVGICLMSEAVKFPDEILRDFNIDMTHIDEYGEELGRIIGVKMFGNCPETLKRLAALNDTEEKVTTFNVQGTIKQISNTDFVVFMLKNNEGKIAKFYWLSFISNSIDNLQYEYKKLKDKRVSLSYIEQELFDPKLNEYRIFNIITEISVLDE